MTDQDEPRNVCQREVTSLSGCVLLITIADLPTIASAFYWTGALNATLLFFQNKLTFLLFFNLIIFSIASRCVLNS